jgi:hypothetical protein
VKRTNVAVPLFVAALGSGCALAPPFKSSGPSVSQDGVQLAVTRQRCDQVPEPDEYGWDLVEATLEVQIRNATSAKLMVRRDAFRLLGPDGTALKTVTWSAADPLTIDGGATGTFQLRFMTHGGLECAREMALDVDAGLSLPAGPVKIGTVKFIPSRGTARREILPITWEIFPIRFVPARLNG